MDFTVLDNDSVFTPNKLYRFPQNLAQNWHQKKAASLKVIRTTFVEAESITWRQWHHWNYIDSIAQITLKEGLQTITIRTFENGQMNYDYINF